MYYFVTSIVSWLLFFISWFIFFPIACIVWLLTVWNDPGLKFLHWTSCIWGSILTWVNPLWKVRISGRDKIKADRTYILISNHQSMLDILVLYRLFKRFKWVSKAELFKIPIIGWNMSLNRYISVDRGTKSGHMRMMRKCEENLKQGNSIMIFPEGTRSRDGNIHTFKEGAFLLAKSCKVDIVPIILKGTFAAFPDHGLIFRQHSTIQIEVLDPIPFENFKDMEVKMLAKHAQEILTANFKTSN